MTGVLAGTTTPAHAVQVIAVSVGIPLVVLGQGRPDDRLLR